MSDQQQPGYWLASDGKWYPPAPATAAKKSHKVRWIVLAVVAVIIIAAMASGGAKKGTVATAPATTAVPVAAAAVTDPPTTAAPVTDPPTTAAATKILLAVTGSGIKTTQKFTTSGADWDLAWSYSCAAFGNQGNFIVNVNGGDGSNAGVNELGASGSSVEHFHSGGTMYLEMNSECNWSVKVTG